MHSHINYQSQLESKISRLLGKQIRIMHKGDQGIGNTWQEKLDVTINNKAIADWHGIEVKCLTFKNENMKGGSDLTLSTKTPDWKVLEKFGISESSFYHQYDYGYLQRGKSLFFTKSLRYIVSSNSRTIDWYVVPLDFPVTEPYSRAPAISGKPVFSWTVEELRGKVNKLSLTLVRKRGDYPNGTITALRSYTVELTPEKFVQLLFDGSIRYEIRRSIDGEILKKAWSGILLKTRSKFGRKHPSRESWEWADSEFERRWGNKWHDHGTGFRLRRPVLNSLLSLQAEIL